MRQVDFYRPGWRCWCSILLLNNHIFFRLPRHVVARLRVTSRKTTSFEIVRELCANAGGAGALRKEIIGTGVVAKMDAPVLESWTKEAKDFASIDPLEKVARLIVSTKNELPLQWLCGRLGGFFVQGPDTFSKVRDKGAQTWFSASLQLHGLRRAAIRAFIDSPEGHPSIDADEARFIARSWADVFGWIEGFLGGYQAGASTAPNRKTTASVKPTTTILFRTTESWQVLDHVLTQETCLMSRKAISEEVAHPFGKPKRMKSGDLRHPNKDTLDKWAQPPPSANRRTKGCANPLDYTLALCLAADSALPLEWLAAKSGGTVLFPSIRPARSDTRDDILRSWERTMVELSELDATIARVFLDRKIDEGERVRLREEWTDVVAWMESFAEEW